MVCFSVIYHTLPVSKRRSKILRFPLVYVAPCAGPLHYALDTDDTLVMRTPSDTTRRRLFADDDDDKAAPLMDRSSSLTPALGLVEPSSPFGDDESDTPKNEKAGLFELFLNRCKA